MPARLQDLKRVLASLGVVVVEPNTGSHYKAIRGSITYPIPAHNGLKTEIGDEYIRGLCRAFHLDIKELKKSL